MKKLVCDLCGSTDLIKKDGVFVCESCGTKYTLEEAKKMLVDGVVNVQGVVQVDDSHKVDNYFEQAETFLEAGDIEKAKEYCDKILDNDVGFAKAWLLKGQICFGSEYKSSLTYFKKAVNIAQKQGENQHSEILGMVNEVICKYFENVCDKYNLIGFIARTKYHLDIFSDYTKISKALVLDKERIRNVFEDYTEKQIYLHYYFKVQDDYDVFENESNFEAFRDMVLPKLIKYGLLTDSAFKHLGEDISSYVEINVNKAYDLFCVKKAKYRGDVTDSLVDNFEKPILASLGLMESVLDKVDGKVLQGGANALEIVVPRLLELEWENKNNVGVGFKSEFKNSISDRVAKINRVVEASVFSLTKDDSDEQDLEDVFEEEENSGTKFVCQKCGKEFYHDESDDVYDDQKEGVICPECGGINKKEEAKVEEEEAEEEGEKIINEEALEVLTNAKKDIIVKVWKTLVKVFFLNVLLLIVFIYGVHPKFEKYREKPEAKLKAKVAEVYVKEKVVASVEEKVFNKGDEFKYFIEWTSKKIDCDVLKNKVRETFDGSKFEVKNSDCTFIEKNTIYFVLNLKALEAGYWRIPSVALEGESSEPVYIKVRDEEVLLKGIENLDFAVIDKNIDKEKGIEHIKVGDENAVFYMLNKAENKALDIVKYVNNLNMVNDKGVSLLIWAVVHKNNLLLDYLLRNSSVDIDHIDDKGRTAVMYAAIKNNTYAIKKLIGRGANLYLSEDGEWNAYKYAKELGNKDAMSLLPWYDEIVYYMCDCEVCNPKTAKFKEFIKKYKSLKVRYMTQDNLSRELDKGNFDKSTSSFYNPVVLLRNSSANNSKYGKYVLGSNGKNRIRGRGIYLLGWSGDAKVIEDLFRSF